MHIRKPEINTEGKMKKSKFQIAGMAFMKHKLSSRGMLKPSKRAVVVIKS